MKPLMIVQAHHFWPDALSPDSVVIDLGAHLGEFSRELSERFGCHCFAVEASPDLYEQIPKSPLIHAYNYAVGAKDGFVAFHISENLQASSTHASIAHKTSVIETPAIRFQTFLDRAGIRAIDLLKVDIEGSEIDLFESTSDETFRACKQITIEFHDFVPGLVSKKQVKFVKKRLISLGFSCIVFHRRDHSDDLFVRREACGISIWQWRYYKYIQKYMDGIRRIFAARFRSLQKPT